jgi:hypothetical protein
VIPRHLGPARDEVARARHPAGAARTTGVGAPTTAPSGRAASRPRTTPKPKRMPPELAETLATIDRLFSTPETGA